jgi:hypothetical protein
VNNPWLNLRDSEGSHIAEIDRDSIDRYNILVGNKERKVIDKSIPEPFIGDPNSAKLILLSLNPGHSEKDLDWHNYEKFRNAMLSNLEGRNQEYPFYPLNPAFEGSGAGEWWQPRTLELKRESGLNDEAFARKLLVIEWFPYHTEKAPARTKRICGSTGRICASQEYSFQLAKQMLDRKGAKVVGMRSKKQWIEADARFGTVPFLKNPQCGYISRGNTEDGLFDEMVKVLRD